MCVVRVRASPNPSNTAPYSPSAQRYLALRGAQPLPRLEAKKQSNNRRAVAGGTKEKTQARRRGVEVWVTDGVEGGIYRGASTSLECLRRLPLSRGLNRRVRPLRDLPRVGSRATRWARLAYADGKFNQW